jgi:hydroxyacylglutathione hydrolase
MDSIKHFACDPWSRNMGLEVKTFVLGPLQNNSYLVIDSDLREAIVVDPSFNVESLIQFAAENQITITEVWLTHAHYDHFAGLFTLRTHFPALKTALHPHDISLWEKGGLSAFWNLKIEADFTPEISLENGMNLSLGRHQFTVLHTPGHSPGHVVFYNEALNCAFCGDLIFNRGVGRTDLPGGNEAELQNSILNQIFNLPPSTTLFSGHGLPTTVMDEQNENPYF